MNLDKVLTRLSSAPHDRAELSRVARALGSELSRERLDILHSFRKKLTRLPFNSCEPGDLDAASYTSGYMAALQDLAAAYEVNVRKRDDDRAVERMALRKECREVLLLLREGPRQPREMKSRLRCQRRALMRSLHRLRAAGLVQVTGPLDRSPRCYRLTVEGRRLVASFSPSLSDDVARGIRIAVRLFQHLLSHETSPASSLEAIADYVLDEPRWASQAVQTWAEEVMLAGLVAEETVRSSPGGAPEQRLPSCECMSAHSVALWQEAPSLLRQLEARADVRVPVYVRTSDESWGAWAYALGQGSFTSKSRTIVDGDIVSRSLQPPNQRFHLLYDDLQAIHSDRQEPTMRAFMERAEEKFVVAGPDDDTADIPEGFIRLRVTPELSEEDPSDITATG